MTEPAAGPRTAAGRALLTSGIEIRIHGQEALFAILAIEAEARQIDVERLAAAICKGLGIEVTSGAAEPIFANAPFILAALNGEQK